MEIMSEIWGMPGKLQNNCGILTFMSRIQGCHGQVKKVWKMKKIKVREKSENFNFSQRILGKNEEVTEKLGN